MLVPATLIGCDEVEEEEPEKACQNALPRRCMSVCDAIDASAACCGVGVGDDADVEADAEPRLGEEGGVGYIEAKEDGTGWCLPLRSDERAGVEELLRRFPAEEK